MTEARVERAGREVMRIAAAGLFVAAYVAARIILEREGNGTALRVAAALLPVVPFLWVLWEIILAVRGLDELDQRIQLEALAVAFPLAVALLLVLGLLQLAVPLPAEDLSYRHVWAVMPLFYAIGLALAKRRYQ